MRVLLTGGGTGGHVTPFEPIIESLRGLLSTRLTQLPGWLETDRVDIFFAGVLTPEAKDFFDSFSVKAKHIPAGKLRRYVSHLTLVDLLFRFPVGICMALWHVWYLMPDVVVSKGGYGSVPVVLAAWFYRIPILLHESDAVPGLASASLTRFVTAVALGFSDAREKLPERARAKSVVTGIPVRSQFKRIAKDQARRKFELDLTEPVLLIMGGSQGAQQINELLLAVLPQLIARTQVLHITGPDNYDSVTTVAQELLSAAGKTAKYQAFPYLGDRFPEALCAADVIVSRAGATSLAEIAAVKIPALLIPLANSAADHQRINAAVFERAGAARVLDPQNLGPNLFLHNIEELLTNTELKKSLAEGLSKLAQPNAATDLAELTLKLAQGLAPTYTS